MIAEVDIEVEKIVMEAEGLKKISVTQEDVIAEMVLVIKNFMINMIKKIAQVFIRIRTVVKGVIIVVKK